jgi:hypothetical protein
MPSGGGGHRDAVRTALLRSARQATMYRKDGLARGISHVAGRVLRLPRDFVSRPRNFDAATLTSND